MLRSSDGKGLLLGADLPALGAYFLAATLASEMRFESRPELVSYLLFAATLHLLHRRAERRKAPPFLLPVFQLLWIDLHGGLHVLGLGAQACFVAAPLPARIGAGRARPGPRVVPATVAGAVALVTVVLGLRVFRDACYLSSRRSDRLGLSWNRVTPPVDAVRRIPSLGPEGKMLNHLNFGGYLGWALETPAFIDGVSRP